MSRCSDKQVTLMTRRAYNRLNLIGEQFSLLTVISFEGIEEGRRESLWKCVCDCGNEVIKRAGDLKSGNTKSCGCYHKIRTRELFSISDEEIRVNRVFCDYRMRSRQRKFDFSLSKEVFAQLMDEPCYYCGGKPVNTFIQHGRQLRPYQGIDRKDNSKGYTPENCVPCCIVCNKMKKAKNHDEFIQHVLKIANRFEVVSPQIMFFSAELNVL